MAAHRREPAMPLTLLDLPSDILHAVLALCMVGAAAVRRSHLACVSHRMKTLADNTRRSKQLFPPWGATTADTVRANFEEGLRAMLIDAFAVTMASRNRRRPPHPALQYMLSDAPKSKCSAVTFVSLLASYCSLLVGAIGDGKVSTRLFTRSPTIAWQSAIVKFVKNIDVVFIPSTRTMTRGPVNDGVGETFRVKYTLYNHGGQSHHTVEGLRLPQARRTRCYQSSDVDEDIRVTAAGALLML